MRQLAAELGRALLFDATCWYCGCSIYLYANPNGGFAIFDDGSPPWPKHECRGLSIGTSQFTDVLEYPPASDWPIPAYLTPAEASDGEQVNGTVVETTAATMTIYTGRALYKFATPRPVNVGARVAGRARRRDGAAFLESVELVEVPPDLDTGEAGSSDRIIDGVSQQDLLLLEDAALEFAKEGSHRAQYVLGALRCLSAQRPMAALNLLLEVLPGNRKPPALARARMAEFVFRLLEAVGGQSLVPRLWGKLRSDLGAVLEPAAEAMLARILKAAAKPGAAAAAEEFLRRTRDAREDDDAFIDSLRRQLPAIAGVRSSLRYQLTGQWE